jgi:hypothetical protein
MRSSRPVPPELILENKKPAGALRASGLMSVLFSESLCTPQQARHVVAMMMAVVRPEMIRNLHLVSSSLNKPIACVNPSEAPKNRYVNRVFRMLAKIDFRRLLRYFPSTW